MIKYTDETDKAYGLAGMAISLVAWDAEEWLDAINLDAAPDEAIQMSAEFYMNIAPRIGAKALWEQSLKRFQLTVAMTVANVACREIIKNKRESISIEADAELRTALYEEGAELCSLDEDEINSIYRKSLNYCYQLFTHYDVKNITTNIVKIILDKREISRENISIIFSLLKLT